MAFNNNFDKKLIKTLQVFHLTSDKSKQLNFQVIAINIY